MLPFNIMVEFNFGPNPYPYCHKSTKRVQLLFKSGLFVRWSDCQGGHIPRFHCTMFAVFIKFLSFGSFQCDILLESPTLCGTEIG